MNILYLDPEYRGKYSNIITFRYILNYLLCVICKSLIELISNRDRWC